MHLGKDFFILSACSYIWKNLRVTKIGNLRNGRTRTHYNGPNMWRWELEPRVPTIWWYDSNIFLEFLNYFPLDRQQRRCQCLLTQFSMPFFRIGLEEDLILWTKINKLLRGITALSEIICKVLHECRWRSFRIELSLAVQSVLVIVFILNCSKLDSSWEVIICSWAVLGYDHCCWLSSTGGIYAVHRACWMLGIRFSSLFLNYCF